MSDSTPNKNQSESQSYKSFSPVTLSESPASVSPQKNLTGLPRVARDIAADVYNNIQRWNDNHINGAKIVKAIANLKATSQETYPDSLETLMNDLIKVVQNLSGIASALEFLASQMNALIKLYSNQNGPLFISLTATQLADIVKDIAEAYKLELKVREQILEEIAHVNSKNDVVFYAACWTHQQNITNDINVKLETLLTETGHRKIT